MDRTTTVYPPGHASPRSNHVEGPPTPPQPALAAAADVEKRLGELVNRLSRISAVIVCRPVPGKEAGGNQNIGDLSGLLASANANINAAFAIVNQIDSDLMP